MDKELQEDFSGWHLVSEEAVEAGRSLTFPCFHWMSPRDKPIHGGEEAFPLRSRESHRRSWTKWPCRALLSKYSLFLQPHCSPTSLLHLASRDLVFPTSWASNSDGICVFRADKYPWGSSPFFGNVQTISSFWLSLSV